MHMHISVCSRVGVRHCIALVLLLVFVLGTSSRPVARRGRGGGGPGAIMPRKAGGKGGGGKEAGNVEVSRKTESHILEVLKSRSKEDTTLEATGIKKVGKVYDELIAMDFTQESAALAIQSTPVITVENCLDWACMNLEEDQLPRKLRSSYRPAEMRDGKVTIVAPPKFKAAAVVEVEDEASKLANAAAAQVSFGVL